MFKKYLDSFVWGIIAVSIVVILSAITPNLFAQQAPPAPAVATSNTQPISGTVTVANPVTEVGITPYQGASGTTQTPVATNSGVGANTAQTATLTGAVGKFTYLTHFDVSATGATAGSCFSVQITGVTAAQSYVYCVPTGATTQNPPLIINFQPPMQSSAANTNIVITMPAAGAGNAGQTINAVGFLQ
jgi:hypothetical protein